MKNYQKPSISAYNLTSEERIARYCDPSHDQSYAADGICPETGDPCSVCQLFSAAGI